MNEFCKFSNLWQNMFMLFVRHNNKCVRWLYLRAVLQWKCGLCNDRII
jgi:hypothetical protein